MRDLIQLVEDSQQEYPLWQTCLDGDPQVKKLCALLCQWGAGYHYQQDIQAKLLALEPVAKRYTGYHPVLYRGFTLRLGEQESLARNGYFDIVTPVDKPLASFTSDLMFAEEFISSYEGPWIVFEKKKLEIFCDLDTFEKGAKSYTKLGSQDEIIVKMPPVMRVTYSDIQREYGLDLD